MFRGWVELKKQQDAVEERKQESLAFQKAASEWRDHQPKAAEPKSKKAKVLSIPQYQGPRKMPKIANESIAQPTLKPLLPPDCYIWLKRSPGAWCTRYPPLGEHCKRFDKCGGEHAAAMLAVQLVWSDWLETNGYGSDACPIVGLFDSPDAVDLTGASSSSHA